MQARPSAVPNPAQLLDLAGAGRSPAESNLGQYVTAAMLAAAQDGCDCETCKLMAQAGKLMRQGLVTG